MTKSQKKLEIFTFCAITFEPIKIETCLAPQNDHLNLSFVKDMYVVGKKNGYKWLYKCHLQFSFFTHQSLLLQTAIGTVVEDSNNLHLTEDGFLMVSLLKEKYFLAARPLFYQGSN